MGRRFLKKSTINGVLTQHHHYLYRGYLQIAALDMKTDHVPALRYIHMGPNRTCRNPPHSDPENATWYSYSHDLTKNVTELYQSDGLIATTYDYSPYGAVTAEGTDQPLQWSSEYHDAELALSYYNYRHYNPTDGRWINRDPLGENGGVNLYAFVRNNPILNTDYLGKDALSDLSGAYAGPALEQMMICETQQAWDPEPLQKCKEKCQKETNKRQIQMGNFAKGMQQANASINVPPSSLSHLGQVILLGAMLIVLDPLLYKKCLGDCEKQFGMAFVRFL